MVGFLSLGGWLLVWGSQGETWQMLAITLAALGPLWIFWTMAKGRFYSGGGRQSLLLAFVAGLPLLCLC